MCMTSIETLDGTLASGCSRRGVRAYHVEMLEARPTPLGQAMKNVGDQFRSADRMLPSYGACSEIDGLWTLEEIMGKAVGCARFRTR